jgi:hypothetical protein
MTLILWHNFRLRAVKIISTMKPDISLLFQFCEEPTPFGKRIGKVIEGGWKRSKYFFFRNSIMKFLNRLFNFFRFRKITHCPSPGF